jgi:hypothetical protein
MKGIRIEDKIRLLMARNPVISLRLGDSYVNIVVDNELHRLSLRFNGSTDISKIDYRTTFQHRTMSGIGFTTKNGITYNYNDGEHDIWVRFWHSKIQSLKHNLAMVSEVTYKPKIGYQDPDK